MSKNGVAIRMAALLCIGVAVGCGANEAVDTTTPPSSDAPSVTRPSVAPPDGTRWSVARANDPLQRVDLVRKSSSELRDFASTKMGITIEQDMNPIEAVPADRLVQLLEAAWIGPLTVGNASCSVDMHAYPDALEKIAAIDGAKRVDDTTWYGELNGTGVYYGVHPSGLAVAAVCTGPTTVDAIRQAVSAIAVTK